MVIITTTNKEKEVSYHTQLLEKFSFQIKFNGHY